MIKYASCRMKGVVFKVICQRSKSNPVLSRELEEAVNVSGPGIRNIIRQLRRSGEPVVASDRGYCLASNPEEVNLIVEDLRKRIKSMGETISKLQRGSYERFEPQRQFLFSPAGSQVQEAAEEGSDEVRQDCQDKGSSRGLLHVQADSRKDKPRIIQREQPDFALDDLLRSR